MLMQPTLDKLYSMKLTGMAEAIRRQMEDPEASRLSFEERLALLVDQQWDWRQNKALERRLKSARFKTAAAVEDIDYRGVAVIADFQKVAALTVGQRSNGPIIDQKDVDAGNAVQERAKAAISASDGQIAKQTGSADVERGESLADRFLSQRRQ